MIIRSNGEPTYFAADIGYVTEKFSRGFDHLIYIWGADHHGTVARRPERGGGDGLRPSTPSRCCSTRGSGSSATASRSRCSKRAGEFITLDELLAEVGVDAARWFFASRGSDDGDRLRHRAREEAVEREPGLLRPVRPRPDRLDPAQGGGDRPGPGDDRRRAARRADPRRRSPGPSFGFPEVVEDAVIAEETQGITAYATELATAFHAFYRDARVVDPAEPERSAARLALARAAQDHAGATRSACSGSRRPSRCSGRRAGRGQPASPRTPAIVPRTRVVAADRRPSASCRPSPGSDRARAAGARHARRSPRSRTRPHRLACPRPCARTMAQASSGPVERARSGRRPSRPRRLAALGRRRPRSQIADLELAERVLVIERPAAPRACSARSVGQVDGDRRLARRVLVGMEDLLGRRRRVAERLRRSPPSRRPAADRTDPWRPRRGRESDLRLDDRRASLRAPRGGRVVGAGEDLGRSPPGSRSAATSSVIGVWRRPRPAPGGRASRRPDPRGPSGTSRGRSAGPGARGRTRGRRRTSRRPRRRRPSTRTYSVFGRRVVQARDLALRAARGRASRELGVARQQAEALVQQLVAGDPGRRVILGRATSGARRRAPAATTDLGAMTGRSFIEAADRLDLARRSAASDRRVLGNRRRSGRPTGSATGSTVPTAGLADGGRSPAGPDEARSAAASGEAARRRGWTTHEPDCAHDRRVTVRSGPSMSLS